MDLIFQRFLQAQYENGAALARESDLLDLIPVQGNPPQRYIAAFHCKGLIRKPGGAVEVASQFAVGIWFPDDYLRRADTFQILTWLEPANVFHPNIRPPLICIGPVSPNTPLVELLHRIYSVVTYQNKTLDERKALNYEACAWARAEDNLKRFPIDLRPIKRRRITLKAEPRPQEEAVLP